LDEYGGVIYLWFIIKYIGKKYFYMGVVKWYIAFIDNYVDKMLILFLGPSQQ
jgi:hypothetical protein